MIIEEMQKRRKELGLTYEALAEKAGVPLSTVQKILGGFTQNPNYRTVLALEEALRPEKPFLIEEEPYPMVREARTAYLTKQSGAYTVEDIARLPRAVRCELWDGEMVLLAAPSEEHELAVGFLVGELYSSIKSVQGGCKVFASNKGVRKESDDRNYLLPDVQIKCASSKTEKGVPDFVIEVASPSSESADLNRKPLQYKKFGVREYWVIFLKQEKIVVYDFEHDAPISFYTFEDKVPLLIYGGELEIDMKELKAYLKR